MYNENDECYYIFIYMARVYEIVNFCSTNANLYFDIDLEN